MLNLEKMNIYLEAHIEGQEIGKQVMKEKACKVFSEMLIELCPDLLGYGTCSKEWENEFSKRLEE